MRIWARIPSTTFFSRPACSMLMDCAIAAHSRLLHTVMKHAYPFSPKSQALMRSPSTSDKGEYAVPDEWNADWVLLDSKSELNDLIRDLNLPKQPAELLAFRLQEKHLETSVSASFYHRREAELRKYFHSDGQLVYCADAEGLLLAMGLPAYHSSDKIILVTAEKDA